MKKFLAFIIVSLSIVLPVEAQSTLSFGTPANSFTASSSGATTAGTAYALPGNPAAIITWTTSYSATPDAVTILLEGSLDNTTYFTLDTSTSTAGGIRSVITSARFVRASITAKTGTFNTTVGLVAKAGVWPVLEFGAADVALQPPDSTGDGYNVDISGGNAANGFTGGEVTIDAGAEIGGGSSGSVSVLGGTSGNGGNVIIQPGLGTTSGIVRLAMRSDGAGLTRNSNLSYDQWSIATTRLKITNAAGAASFAPTADGTITVRNSNNTANGDIIANSVFADSDIGAAEILSGGFLQIFPPSGDTDPVDIRDENNVQALAVNPAGLTTIRELKVAEVLFGSLPASPVVGQLANVSDSNTIVWGATVAGTGSNHILARWNGTNWTVVGK